MSHSRPAMSASEDSRLLAAAHSGNASLVRRLLSEGVANPCAASIKDRTPLMLALAANSWECASLLLPFSSVEARDGEGDTALMFACSMSSGSCVQLLLSEGKANPNVANASGRTPLDICCVRSNIEGIRLLLAAGCDPRFGDSSGGHFPLIRLAQGFFLDGLRLLAPLCDPDFPNPLNGMTPLMHACSTPGAGAALACVGFLASISNILAKNKRGLTAFDLALVSRRYDCANLLALLMPDAMVEASLASNGKDAALFVPQWAARREARLLGEAARLPESSSPPDAPNRNPPPRL